MNMKYLTKVRNLLIKFLYKTKLSHSEAVIDSTKYDMFLEPNEEYYFEQYWSICMNFLPSAEKSLLLGDFGCGQGRFTINLANTFKSSEIIAVDVSESAVNAAKKNAVNNGVFNIQFLVCDLKDFITSTKAESFDVIFLIETLFFIPNWQETIKDLESLLKPNGILLVSLRSSFYNLMYSVKNKNFSDGATILKTNTSNLWGSPIEFAWTSSEDFKSFIAKDTSFSILCLQGIGSLSGIEGDPHEAIAVPYKLNKYDRDLLMDLELKIGAQLPDSGRYFLAILKKS